MYLQPFFVTLLYNFIEMKKVILLLSVMFSLSFLQAQYLVEDNDVTENSSEMGKGEISFDLNNPLEFYRLKCQNATYAQYVGGENAFKQKLIKSMRANLDNTSYSVNGTFDFIFYLDKEGNLKDFTLKPEVTNSMVLQSDLKSAVKALNQKWIPATCNGAAIESKIRLKVNFRTEMYDL